MSTPSTTAVPDAALGQPAHLKHLSVKYESRVALALFLTALCCGLIVTFAPIDILLNNFIPDDSFYAHKTALNIMRGYGSTFDTINPTNGYHPLWVWLEVPVFWFFGGGGEGPLRAILALQAFLWGIAAVLLYKLCALAGDSVSAAGAAFAWVAFTVLLMVNGLETVLYCSLLCALMLVYLRTYDSEVTVTTFFFTGLLLGLTFLGRTDSGFLALFLCGDLFWRTMRKRLSRGVLKLAACYTPAALLAGAYLIGNFIQFGAFMQVSGNAKTYYSKLILADAVTQGQSVLSVYLRNLIWPLTAPNYYVIAGVLLIPVMFAAMLLWNRLSGGREPIARLYLRCWPLWLSFVTLYLFYALVYKGQFSQTNWYYTPAYFHTAFLAMALLHLFRKRVAISAAWPAALCAFAYLIAEPLTLRRLLTVALAVALVSAWTYLLHRINIEPKFLLPAYSDTAIFLCLAALILYRVRLYSATLLWLSVATGAAVAVGRLVKADDRGLQRIAATALGVVLCSFPLRYVMSRNMNLDTSYNYLLYRGALWLKENTAPETIITAGSAGILGYFSERRVINTDGLINSYDFLNSYLKQGRTMEYLRRSDIFADVYSMEYGWALRAAYPSGSFLDLPDTLKLGSFVEGAARKHFAVYLLDSPKRRFLKSFEAGELIPNGDFEQGLAGWSKTGTAFDNQPTYGDNSYARGVLPSRHRGNFWIGTFENRPSEDAPAAKACGNECTGTLTSAPFVLKGRKLSFLVGGGDLPGTRVEVLIDAKPVFVARGNRLDSMRRVELDIEKYAGETAQIRIVDEETGPWGVINADDFRLVP